MILLSSLIPFYSAYLEDQTFYKKEDLPEVNVHWQILFCHTLKHCQIHIRVSAHDSQYCCHIGSFAFYNFSYF